MRLSATQAVFPSRVVTNHELVDIVRSCNQGTFTGDLSRTCDQIRLHLDLSGAEERRWVAVDEKPIDLIEQAVTAALAEAGMDRNDIDMLIYVGVCKAFVEPASSYMVAHALGMKRVHCFDISDACNSYARALYIADSLLQLKRYGTILIVNAECSMAGRGAVPRVFRLSSKEQLPWTFPVFTVGEAVTATILQAEPEREWIFHWDSAPELADLCTTPLSGFAGFCHPTDKVGKNGIQNFTSYGNQLHAVGQPFMMGVIAKLSAVLPEVRIVIPHTSSRAIWQDAADGVGIGHLMWHLYPKYGNIVSASIPAGLATAVQKGALVRGDRVAGISGSAGASFVALSFVY